MSVLLTHLFFVLFVFLLLLPLMANKVVCVCVYTMLTSMRKSKNRYFYIIFVSPGDAPRAITLNVVWMEREFDAYKLSRCMCPSKYNRF